MFILDYPNPEIYNERDYPLRELYLYQGNQCNRHCAFCTVFGQMNGWLEPYNEDILDYALKLISSDGHIKFYGGEPSLNVKNQRESISYLREKGFNGRITLFTNGVEFTKLQEILNMDSQITLALNYSIFHGRETHGLSPSIKQKILDYQSQFPNRIYLGHADLIPAGRGSENKSTDNETPHFDLRCPRCFPVLTSRGEIRACPFNVEIQSVYHFLGDITDSPNDVIMHYRLFRDWIESAISSFVNLTGRFPCDYCLEYAAQAPFLSARDRKKLWG